MCSLVRNLNLLHSSRLIVYIWLQEVMRSIVKWKIYFLSGIYLFSIYLLNSFHSALISLKIALYIKLSKSELCKFSLNFNFIYFFTSFSNLI